MRADFRSVLALALCAACAAPARTTATIAGPDAAVAVDAGTLAPDDSGAEAGSDVAQDAVADTVGGADLPIDATEQFWIAYRRVPTPQALPDVAGVRLTDWRNPVAGLGNGPGELGSGVDPHNAGMPAIAVPKTTKNLPPEVCQHGCFLSPSVQWMARATAPADATGHYTYKLMALDKDLMATPLPVDATLTDVKHLKMLDKFVFYTQKANCLGTGACQYTVHRRGPLGEAGDTDVVLTKMAPDADPDVAGKDTVYNGYFSVSVDTSTLVFLTPTIRSQRLYVWRAGKVEQLTYFCPNLNDGMCVGTGSQYHDNDPLAVSADGQQIVWFAVDGRFWRVWRYQLGAKVTATFSNLAEVPEGKSYLFAACDFITKETHVRVAGDPRLSPDNQWLWFVGQSKCDPNGGKVWTDVMSLRVSQIGLKMGPGDWINWTHQPRDKSVDNKQIQSMALSPLGQVVVVSADASVGPDGKPLADNALALAKKNGDTELYTLTVGAHQLVPVTNEGAWYVSGPVALAPTAP